MDLDGDVLVVSTTSICFPHLSCPLLQTHLYISTIVFHPRILLHETVDVTKYIFSTTGAFSAGQRSLPGQVQQMTTRLGTLLPYTDIEDVRCSESL